MLESLLSGAYVFMGADGYYRDIAGIHGSYKRIAHTEAAIELVGNYLAGHGVAQAHWYFDQPVSNSGRLKALTLDIAQTNNWPWTAELVFNPDKALVEGTAIAISSDAWVLDHAVRNFNLVAQLAPELKVATNVVAV